MPSSSSSYYLAMIQILLAPVLFWARFCRFSGDFDHSYYYGGVQAFVPNIRPFRRIRQTTPRHSSFRVPFQQVIQNLTPSEQSVATVAQQAGPSVVYVTSILPFPQNRRRRQNGKDNNNSTDNLPPPGQSLGSGSGFLVEQDGYIVTNYHVIEQAHRLQRMDRQYDALVGDIVGNATRFLGPPVQPLVESILQPSLMIRPPSVYIRLASATSTTTTTNNNNKQSLQKCRIVDVQPELDIAVLKLLNATKDITTTPSTSFGRSSELLVGQTVVAIGNPFGLDSTVTSGVVSALNRDLQLSPSSTTRQQQSSSAVIRNCIQTDASINPGNSGGPLYNLQSQVIGVNTAIVTTSGSNAGIGFAIPSDAVQPVVQDMIRRDRRKNYYSNDNNVMRGGSGWLGLTVIRSSSSHFATNTTKCWVTSVQEGSPASRSQIQPLAISEQGQVLRGDAIVAIKSKPIESYEEFRAELDKCVVGEEVNLTLENVKGESRVVYLKLSAVPVSE